MIIVRGFDRLLVRHSPFDSGEPTLDAWLKEQAGQADRRNDVRTIIAADEATTRIAGYHASVTFRLAPREVGESLGRIRRYPVPAVLLARLAVDKDYQGSGIGKLLLFDALERFERASRDIGFEVVVVDALHEDAACFYLKYGFRRFLDHELRLFMTTSDLRASFAQSGDDVRLKYVHWLHSHVDRDEPQSSSGGKAMSTQPAPERSARLNMRIAPDALELLREAAAAQQQDVTAFVLGAAMERARAVLMEQRVMVLTAREVAQVDEALDREPSVIPELAALIREVKGQKVEVSAKSVRA